MKEMLVKVESKSVILRLREKFGDFEQVSSIFNIYSVNLTPDLISELENSEGVLNVEEDSYYEIQT